MDWIEFSLKVTSQLIWIGIAIISIVLTFWQLWDLYGFKIRAWWAAERKARLADAAWRQFIRTAWNTPAKGWVNGS